MQWALVYPLELVAASFTIRYWDPNQTISVAVWITLFGQPLLSDWKIRFISADSCC